MVEGEDVAYIREMTGFPGIEMILRVDREIKRSRVVTGLETRHFIASLGADEASPKRLMDTVRGHWGVEDRQHFIKDRWWEKTAHGVPARGWRNARPPCATER